MVRLLPHHNHNHNRNLNCSLNFAAASAFCLSCEGGRALTLTPDFSVPRPIPTDCGRLPAPSSSSSSSSSSSPRAARQRTAEKLAEYHRQHRAKTTCSHNHAVQPRCVSPKPSMVHDLLPGSTPPPHTAIPSLPSFYIKCTPQPTKSRSLVRKRLWDDWMAGWLCVWLAG